MSGFDDDAHDEELDQYLGMYIGEVVKRDPVLKRVKVKIDGLIDDESAWACPITAGAGGSPGVGMVGTPRIGANVLVWFANGRDERPFYAPGYWGDGEVPEEADGKEDVTIWSSENFAIVMDDSEGSTKLRIVNRKTDDYVELDADANAITIKGTTAVSIDAVGVVALSGAVVRINGRVVQPTDAPI